MATTPDRPGWHQRARDTSGPQLYESSDDLPITAGSGDLAIVDDGSSLTLYRFEDGGWKSVATSNSIFPFTSAYSERLYGYSMGDTPRGPGTDWDGSSATHIMDGSGLGDEPEGPGTSWDGSNVNET